MLFFFVIVVFQLYTDFSYEIHFWCTIFPTISSHKSVFLLFNVLFYNALLLSNCCFPSKFYEWCADIRLQLLNITCIYLYTIILLQAFFQEKTPAYRNHATNLKCISYAHTIASNHYITNKPTSVALLDFIIKTNALLYGTAEPKQHYLLAQLIQKMILITWIMMPRRQQCERKRCYWKCMRMSCLSFLYIYSSHSFFAPFSFIEFGYLSALFVLQWV